MGALRSPTSDTVTIAGAAVAGIRSIYRPGFNFAKAGVMLLDLPPGSMNQGELMRVDDQETDKTGLMTALVELNRPAHSGRKRGLSRRPTPVVHAF